MTLNISRIDARRPESAAALTALRARLAPDGTVVSAAGSRRTMEVFGAPLTPIEVVERICNDVRRDGMTALLHYTEKLDGRLLTREQLRVPAEELAAAHHQADPAYLETIRRIREQIGRFQEAILHGDVEVGLPGGGRLTQRYTPLRRIGVCVPGGAAAYPSTVLMTVVPAQAAGVKEIAIAAPPTNFGSYNRDILAACHELGIVEVYRMGGAQGVAALAYGVDDVVSRVDKIVGPGNLFVALAKQRVYGEVDIDSLAGPSEVIVLADGTCPPAYAAADMIAQAEHAPGSSLLITWEPTLADAVARELDKQVASLQRGDLAREALESFGALIVVGSRSEGAALAEQLATEHLHLQCSEPRELLTKIHSAGAVFIGPYSPVAVGDYAAGPSHVLPTGATARFASGLSSNQFLRAGSVIELSGDDLRSWSSDIVSLAEKEGLTGHAESVRIRLHSP